MAKRIEITYTAQMAELAKLNEKLERAEKALTKKRTAAEKMGVADWTDEEHYAWIQGIEKTETGWIVNKADVKKNGAWFDLVGAERDVEDIRERIEKAETRLNKAEAEVNAYREEVARIADLKQKEALWEAEFAEEQREWAKDGIKLEGRYHGTTPAGKQFLIYGNNGWTERSMHCFTLRIDCETIFTSGEFWRAYAEIKRR